MTAPDLSFLGEVFKTEGRLVSTAPIDSGHINDTYVATYYADGRSFRYLHQRLNISVFRQPERVMENIARVLAHLDSDGEADGGAFRLVPALNGSSHYVDSNSAFWRTFTFVENSVQADVDASLNAIEEAAVQFGDFARRLSNLPGPSLHETIPHFHDTAKRYGDLERASTEDVAGRKASCTAELAFARDREFQASSLQTLFESGELPQRVAHNDAKLSNVLLDKDSGKGLCVIDFDTVMPGSPLFDFGDLVRSSVSTAAEDEQDPSRVIFSKERYEAVVHGYLAGAAGSLGEKEIASLPLAARVITFEIGMRFLADYLNGDTYFKTGYEQHNLVRCRTQFALLSAMEAEQRYMESAVTATLTREARPG